MKTVVALFALIAVAAAGCPPLWTSGEGSCYRYFRMPATYDQAQSMCMDFGNCNGDMAQLLKIESHTESQLLHKYLGLFVPETTTLPVWINLRYNQNRRVWMWGDGQILGAPNTQIPTNVYTNFGTQSLPQASSAGACVRTQPNPMGFIWTPASCTANFGFVCQMPSGARPPIGPPRRRPGALTANRL